MRTIRVFLFAAALFAAAPVLAATIRGSVTDSTGAAVPLAQLGRNDLAVVSTLVTSGSDSAFLGQLAKNNPAVVKALVLLLKSPDRSVRSHVAQSLGNLGRRESEVIDAPT